MWWHQDFLNFCAKHWLFQCLELWWRPCSVLGAPAVYRQTPYQQINVSFVKISKTVSQHSPLSSAVRVGWCNMVQIPWKCGGRREGAKDSCLITIVSHPTPCKRGVLFYLLIDWYCSCLTHKEAQGRPQQNFLHQFANIQLNLKYHNFLNS